MRIEEGKIGRVYFPSWVTTLSLWFLVGIAGYAQVGVPTGSVPTGSVPTGSVPTGSVPTGSVPTGAPIPGQSEARASVAEMSVSEWGEDFQVRVVGEPPLVKVVFSTFIDDFRDDVRKLIFKLRLDSPGSRTVWSIPIEVELHGNSGDVSSGDYLRTTVRIRPDNRFVIKLDVKLHDRFEEREFRLELIRALLIEQILVPYGKSPDSFTLNEVKPPDWLVHGIDQLVDHRRGGRLSSFYRGFLESGQMLKPGDLFGLSNAADLDPLSYAIFRASSSVMVEALLNQPDGDVGLRNFLGDLGRPEVLSTEVLLRQHFPAFREVEQGLEKWWALELAALGQQQSLEYLGREETERFLTNALTVRFEAGEEGGGSAAVPKRGILELLKRTKAKPAPMDEPFVGTVDQFSLFLDRPGAKEKLEACRNQLQNLNRTGFPLYRPVFAAYDAAILKLEKGQSRGLETELERIEELRTKIRDTLIRTEDYLNYYEATRAPRRSDAFDDYHKMRKMLEEKPPPGRNDRITRYLDSLEMEFR